MILIIYLYVCLYCSFKCLHWECEAVRMMTFLIETQCSERMHSILEDTNNRAGHSFSVFQRFLCFYRPIPQTKIYLFCYCIKQNKKHWVGWVGLWGFLWWAPPAKRKDHHGVSSGWSSVWHRSNTGLSSTQYEQIPIILGVWTFWLTPFFFRSITFWRAYG